MTRLSNLPERHPDDARSNGPLRIHLSTYARLHELDRQLNRRRQGGRLVLWIVVPAVLVFLIIGGRQFWTAWQQAEMAVPWWSVGGLVLSLAGLRSAIKQARRQYRELEGERLLLHNAIQDHLRNEPSHPLDR